MRLTQLTMKKFAPFADGEILFPAVPDRTGLAEVQMFTGENGTGKTRLLAALMASLGNLNELQSRVRQDSGTELEIYGWSSWWADYREGEDLVWRYLKGGQDRKTQHFGAQIFEEYGNHVSMAQEQDSIPYPEPACGWGMAGIGIALMDEPKGGLISTNSGVRLEDALSWKRQMGPVSDRQRLLNLRMQVAVERDGNSTTSGRLTNCLSALEGAISEITQQTFSLVIEPGREMGLKVLWGKAEMYFSEIPDGLSALLNWLGRWMVFQSEHFEESATPLSEPVILILDEPENHLHPAWQRRVLPAVQRLFPQAQMFVVTHSPFIASSLNVGWIHKFTRGEDGLVRIAPAKEASKGDSYMTAVQEILDLAEWFDPETEKEIAEFETLLDRAYSANGSTEEAMRAKATKLMERSQEVSNLVANLLGQFDRTKAGKTN
jgi:predicted ATP-binding protein involved in virulence